MIISASRRTDIPTYYSDWFYNRIKEGYVYVRNPVNFHRVSRITLSPDVIDGIVFWTKNPVPMMARLGEFENYMYYFQFTLNSYGRDMETNIPSKNDVIIPAFKELSKKIGAERVVWRYDPVLLTSKYDIDYHIKYFNEIARLLSGYTHKCVISFIDFYRNTRKRCPGLLPIGKNEMTRLASEMAEAAHKNNMVIESCAEEIDLENFGITHGHCIDRALFEKFLGCELNLDKDRNQRKECGCAASIDIGMYDTCKNGCRYCYANHGNKTVIKNMTAHNPRSPLISGEIMPEDIIKERKIESCKNMQINMMD